MVIHNATFMVRKEREAEVVLWLKARLNAATVGDGRKPQISAMREAGGESHRHADAASVAFQLEFDSIFAAKKWARDSFAPLAEEFEHDFGSESMVFTSIFEVI